MAKAGRPKSIRPQNIKLILPKHPQKYKAKRLYWAILQLEKKMSKDITSVKMSEYRDAVSAYIDVVELLEKKGIKYGYNKKAKSGMVAETVVAGNTESGTEAGTSENGSSDLGARVPAVNPIT